MMSSSVMLVPTRKDLSVSSVRTSRRATSSQGRATRVGVLMR